MKKLFLVLAVASLGFVACNNEAETDTTAADSARIADSTHAAWVQDSINAANKAAMDTTGKTDSLKK